MGCVDSKEQPAANRTSNQPATHHKYHKDKKGSFNSELETCDLIALAKDLPKIGPKVTKQSNYLKYQAKIVEPEKTGHEEYLGKQLFEIGGNGSQPDGDL